jgi:aminopeptidase N
MRLYFRRHDGHAVTCDDFVQAMQDASGVDLSQFRRWYDVAGTPVLDCSGEYRDGTYMLKVKQSMNPPFHIPLAVKIGPHEQVLSLKQAEESFAFRVAEKPVPSLLRGFSAPVVLNYPYTEDELVHLMAHDDDAFSRWEAGQRLAAEIILRRKGVPSAAFLEAALRVLGEKDHAFVAEALTLPSETFLAEQLEVVDPDALHAARDNLRLRLAEALQPEFTAAYRALQSDAPYAPDPASAGKRALKNLCLAYLAELGLSALADEQFRRSDNMTDAMAALTCLANADCPEREPALQAFYDKWQDEPLVVDKWLMVQATSRLPGALERAQQLLQHPAFDIKVPNKVYALIRSFSANHVRFHAANGSGYEFLADRVIELNALNPQVAARMARGFDRWKKFDAERQAHARRQLERIRDAQDLSRDVAEIVGKSLG